MRSEEAVRAVCGDRYGPDFDLPVVAGEPGGDGAEGGGSGLASSDLGQVLADQPERPRHHDRIPGEHDLAPGDPDELVDAFFCVGPVMDDPAHLVATFLAAFNDGDAAVLEQAYEPLGVLIPRPGFPVTGPDRSAANAYLLDMGLPMDARLRHVYVAGDIALLSVDCPS